MVLVVSLLKFIIYEWNIPKIDYFQEPITIDIYNEKPFSHFFIQTISANMLLCFLSFSIGRFLWHCCVLHATLGPHILLGGLCAAVTICMTNHFVFMLRDLASYCLGFRVTHMDLLSSYYLVFVLFVYFILYKKY